jgi:hypothetical protein
MRGRHAALTIQMSQQTRVTLQGWLHRQKTPGGASQTRAGDVAVRARPQLHSYGQMGRFDRAQPAQMGQAVPRSWSGRAGRLAPTRPHSRLFTGSGPRHS